jgi:NAD(P)-dependent dehydrogenase (short-subunit alcohol dehydrogenase family)
MTSDPGFPADVDYTLLGKLLPAIGDGFAPPSAVAGVIAMLASEDGSFVTGTEIRIDGGTHM